jgi:hypothetical protein
LNGHFKLDTDGLVFLEFDAFNYCSKTIAAVFDLVGTEWYREAVKTVVINYSAGFEFFDKNDACILSAGFFLNKNA